MARVKPSNIQLSVSRIISGGQTGVDRAALDVAIALGLEHGGWCPAGRRAEDGPIPAIYHLQETVTADYAKRTKRNVVAADGTLVLCDGEPTGGTLLTVEIAARRGLPHWVVDLIKPDALDDDSIELVRRWLRQFRIKTLNVAGPRESTSPGIGEITHRFLVRLLNGSLS